MPNTQTDTTFVYLISAASVTNPNRALRGAGASSTHRESIKESDPSWKNQHVVNPAHTRELRRIRFPQRLRMMKRGQEVTQYGVVQVGVLHIRRMTYTWQVVEHKRWQLPGDGVDQRFSQRSGNRPIQVPRKD
jgi:hypothetical protein